MTQSATLLWVHFSVTSLSLVSIMAHGISQEKMDEIGLDAEQVNGWFIQSSKLTPGR